MRLAPVMNLLAADGKCGYKAGRSAMGAIFHIERQFVENEIQRRISIDLSKAPGSISRDKLWWVLYEKGAR